MAGYNAQPAGTAEADAPYIARTRAMAAYSAIAMVVVTLAAVSPTTDQMGLVFGLASLVGLAIAAAVLRVDNIARAGLFAAVWALIYGLKVAGTPLLEIPVYVALSALGLAIANRQFRIPAHRRGLTYARISTHFHLWTSHFKTTAVLTAAFAALSAALLWFVEGAGTDNVLPIGVTIGLSALSVMYAERRSRTRARVVLSAMFLAAVLFCALMLIRFGSHQSVVNAMYAEGGASYRSAVDSETLPLQSFTAFTTNPLKEDCLLHESGERYCDPVNLVFPGQTLDDVKLRLFAAGWINSTRRGSSQFLRLGSQGLRMQDLQMLFYESLSARYHVRLWEVPGHSMVVGAVHHEAGVYHHTIDVDWDGSQRFVERQLCGGGCGVGEAMPKHSAIQGNTRLWRGLVNDGRVAVVSAGR